MIDVTKVTRLAATVLMLCLGGVALTAQPADQTASDFYMSYRAAFDKATAVEELLPLMSIAVRSRQLPRSGCGRAVQRDSSGDATG